jgi:CheY-like chemotaxis protein
MTKILLVEDDKSLREIYGVRLLAEGYEIVSAGDGEEALAIAIKEKPGLIISDVMMPKISGFDMLDILRSTTETKDIKVIMMTALSSEDQRARGESLGADRYLVKSQVGIEDVVRTVHDVLGDGISTPQTAAQTFGTPAPSAVAKPPMAPQAVSTPVIPPQAQTPPMPSPTPAVEPSQPESPTALPQTSPVSVAPVINTPPVQPPQPAPESNPLPQPTAPFSTARPQTLGDRIINPLSEQPPAVDIGNLMNQELDNANSESAPQEDTPPPVVSQIPPVPTPPEIPQN